MSESFRIPERAAVPDGSYDATLKSIETKTSNDGEQYRRWAFNVAFEGKDVEITGMSSTKLGPKSKAYKWLTAILGREPGPGEEIAFSSLVGSPCRIEVAENANGYSGVEDVKRTATAAPTFIPPASSLAPEPDYDDLPF